MDKFVIIEQKLVQELSGHYRIWYIRDYTEFGGCQCRKDCSCAEDFNSRIREYYKCTKLKNKIKTFFEASLHDCYVELIKRNVIDTIPYNPSE